MPVSHPEITADEFSKALCIHGKFQEVRGRGEDMISMHPVDIATIVSLPRALRTSLRASTSAHPWHARCPEARYSYCSTRRAENTLYLSIRSPYSLTPYRVNP